SVTVTGPLEQLQKIDFWATDTFTKDDISHSVIDKISLKATEAPNITIYPPLTEVKIPVEEFTEKQLLVPIKVINNNQYYSVKLIPDRVKITFMVSLSDYERTNEDDFDAVVDLNNWKNFNASMLPIKIVKKKPFA